MNKSVLNLYSRLLFMDWNGLYVEKNYSQWSTPQQLVKITNIQSGLEQDTDLVKVRFGEEEYGALVGENYLGILGRINGNLTDISQEDKTSLQKEFLERLGDETEFEILEREIVGDSQSIEGSSSTRRRRRKSAYNPYRGIE